MMDGMGFGRPLDFEPCLSRPGYIPIVVAGTDPADRPRPRRRARRDPRPPRPRDHRPRHRGRVRHGPGRHRAAPSARSPSGSSTVARRSSSSTSSAWPATSRPTGRTPITTPPTSSASRAIPTSRCRLTLGEAEGHDAGESAMTATAMRVVNAVPYVVDAAARAAQLARPPAHRAPPRLRLTPLHLLRRCGSHGFEDDHGRLCRPPAGVAVELRFDLGPALPQPFPLRPRHLYRPHRAGPPSVRRTTASGCASRLSHHGDALVPAVHRQHDEVRAVLDVADDDAALLPGLPSDGGEEECAPAAVVRGGRRKRPPLSR